MAYTGKGGHGENVTNWLEAGSRGYRVYSLLLIEAFFLEANLLSL